MRRILLLITRNFYRSDNDDCGTIPEENYQKVYRCPDRNFDLTISLRVSTLNEERLRQKCF